MLSLLTNVLGGSTSRFKVDATNFIRTGPVINSTKPKDLNQTETRKNRTPMTRMHMNMGHRVLLMNMIPI